MTDRGNPVKIWLSPTASKRLLSHAMYLECSSTGIMMTETYNCKIDKLVCVFSLDYDSIILVMVYKPTWNIALNSFFFQSILLTSCQHRKLIWQIRGRCNDTAKTLITPSFHWGSEFCVRYISSVHNICVLNLGLILMYFDDPPACVWLCTHLHTVSKHSCMWAESTRLGTYTVGNGYRKHVHQGRISCVIIKSFVLMHISIY